MSNRKLNYFCQAEKNKNKSEKRVAQNEICGKLLAC